MPVGRKPKPTILKVLAGNPGHRPLNKHEPKPSGIPTCPSCLDAAAKREWSRLSKELLSLGLLTSIDRAMLASYCDAWSRWSQATAELQQLRRAKGKSVLVVATPAGNPIQNPLIGIINTAADQCRKFGVELGLSPASRSRLAVEPKKHEIKLDEWSFTQPTGDTVRAGDSKQQAPRVQVGKTSVQ
jgi:P27 family predicted phage terminase small subunit